MKKGDLCYVRPEVFYYMLDQALAGFTTLDAGDLLIILDSSGTYSVTVMSHRGVIEIPPRFIEKVREHHVIL